MKTLMINKITIDILMEIKRLKLGYEKISIKTSEGLIDGLLINISQNNLAGMEKLVTGRIIVIDSDGKTTIKEDGKLIEYCRLVKIHEQQKKTVCIPRYFTNEKGEIYFFEKIGE